MRDLRRLAAAACAVLMAAPAATAAPPDASPRATSGEERILELLERARVVDDIDYQPGYDRDCDPGGCVFGRPWTDDHDGPKGHNGCTTREDVLLMQMRDIEMRWGSSAGSTRRGCATPTPASG